jgi:hypothetical protein
LAPKVDLATSAVKHNMIPGKRIGRFGMIFAAVFVGFFENLCFIAKQISPSKIMYGYTLKKTTGCGKSSVTFFLFEINLCSLRFIMQIFFYFVA